MSPAPISGPYAWWMSVPVTGRAAIRSAAVACGTTSFAILTALYGAYLPDAKDGTLHGFLGWLPTHWFGTVAGLLVIYYRTHLGVQRAANAIPPPP